MVQHGIHGVSPRFKICKRRSEKRKGPLPADTGQDNQAGVNVCGTDERAKISCILGHNHKFTGNAALQHPMVGVSPTAKIQGMLGKMFAARIQCPGYVGRQAFVDEQPHAVS